MTLAVLEPPSTPKTRSALPHELRCPSCDAVAGNTCLPGESPPFCRVRIAHADALMIPVALTADEQARWIRPSWSRERESLTVIATERERAEEAEHRAEHRVDAMIDGVSRVLDEAGIGRAPGGDHLDRMRLLVAERNGARAALRLCILDMADRSAGNAQAWDAAHAAIGEHVCPECGNADFPKVKNPDCPLCDGTDEGVDDSP